MTLEAWLLVASGVVAIGCAAVVFAGTPPRVASVLTGVSVGLLGLLQLGLARAVYAAGWEVHNIWFELCLVFSLAVCVAWVLLSATLGRTDDLSRIRGWRAYAFVQLVLCAAATVGATLTPLVGDTPVGEPRTGVPLTPVGLACMALALVNTFLITANFESTYLSLSRTARQRLAPAVVGIVLCAAFYGYLLGFCLWHRYIPLTDLGVSGIPVAALALLLTGAMTRGRAGEITLSGPRESTRRNAALLVSALTFGGAFGILALTEVTGWSLARAGWSLMTGGLVLGMAALLVSNRLQRRVWWVLQPFLQRPRLRRADLWTRLHREMDTAHTPEDLWRIIPSCVGRIAGLAPVTLFLPDASGLAYVSVSSTLSPVPAARLGSEDPLVRELRRSARPLFLAGRSDDLEYIPIYVENGAQLRLCQAECAAPLELEGGLLGFLLCGHPPGRAESAFDRLPLLEFLARSVAERLEILRLRSLTQGSPRELTPLDTPRLGS